MTPMLLLPPSRECAPPAEPVPSAQELLRVLIAFDDRAAYQRAMRLLVRVLGGERHGLDVRPIPWQFNALELSNWQPLAMLDAAHAHIIIVSTSLAAVPTASIRAWTHACCTVERKSNALLVALLGTPGEPDAPHAPFREYLRELAQRAGLDFLSPHQSAAPEAAITPPVAEACACG